MQMSGRTARQRESKSQYPEAGRCLEYSGKNKEANLECVEGGEWEALCSGILAGTTREGNRRLTHLTHI